MTTTQRAAPAAAMRSSAKSHTGRGSRGGNSSLMKPCRPSRRPMPAAGSSPVTGLAMSHLTACPAVPVHTPGVGAEDDGIRAKLAALPDPVGFIASLFAHAPVGLQIYHASGECLLVNDAFRRIFGAEPPPEYNVLRDDVAARRGVLHFIHRAFRGEVIDVPPVWYDPR